MLWNHWVAETLILNTADRTLFLASEAHVKIGLESWNTEGEKDPQK
mgnify:CR=1 FL=1